MIAVVLIVIVVILVVVVIVLVVVVIVLVVPVLVGESVSARVVASGGLSRSLGVF